MPLAAVGRLEESLDAAGRPHLDEVDEGAAHGDPMADTSTYHEQATERHFAQLRGLLDRVLLPGTS